MAAASGVRPRSDPARPPCYHPRRQTSGTLTERDAGIFHDNDFEMLLDPDGEGRTRVGDPGRVVERGL